MYREVHEVHFEHSGKTMARVGLKYIGKDVIVFRGSMCLPPHPPKSETNTTLNIYRNNVELFNKLINNGKLHQSNGHVYFDQDVRFKTLTEAMRFLYGARRTPSNILRSGRTDIQDN
jgi:hypothetical protein